jgi:hypothetical protein
VEADKFRSQTEIRVNGDVEPEETQKRRELFYELFTYDSWQVSFFGLILSHFPSMTFQNFSLQSLTLVVHHLSLRHMSTIRMPHSTTKNENGEVEMSCMLLHVLSLVRLHLIIC